MVVSARMHRRLVADVVRPLHDSVSTLEDVARPLLDLALHRVYFVRRNGRRLRRRSPTGEPRTSEPVACSTGRGSERDPQAAGV